MSANSKAKTDWDRIAESRQEILARKVTREQSSRLRRQREEFGRIKARAELQALLERPL